MLFIIIKKKKKTKTKTLQKYLPNKPLRVPC
jgi:hypothetical protein